MDEKQKTGKHRITLLGRSQGTVSGITELLSFDEQEIRMDTEMGMLTVRGKNLHISSLSLDQGEAELEGQVDSFVYSARGHKKKNAGNLLQRVLR